MEQARAEAERLWHFPLDTNPLLIPNPSPVNMDSPNDSLRSSLENTSLQLYSCTILSCKCKHLKGNVLERTKIKHFRVEGARRGKSKSLHKQMAACRALHDPVLIANNLFKLFRLLIDHKLNSKKCFLPY